MARRKYYIGDVGPLFFDDESPVDDPDGDFAGEDRIALRTEGSIRASGEDTHEDSLTTKSTVDTLDRYAKNHAVEHLPAGSDPVATKTVTVVTGVDFVGETITTKDITVFDV